MDPKDIPLPTRIGQYLTDMLSGGIIRLAMALPYERRVPLVGWLVSRIVSPLAGWPRRIRRNLAHVWPDLPQAEVERLVRAVPDNFGRAIIEDYSHQELKARIRDITPEGPGWPALAEARASGRPVFMISGHFGNYDAARAFVALNFDAVGALYRPMNNLYFNRHYEDMLGAISQPIFPRGRRGLAEMMKYIRQGNIMCMLNDQHFNNGAPLTYFGKTALTTLSVTEMALKFDALVIPSYSIRQPDGLTFRFVFEAPIENTTPEQMGQALNDSLERRVRENPDQWLWIHRRWKGTPEMGDD